MKEAFDIIELLRSEGFIIHYSRFSDNHLKKMSESYPSEYKEGNNWTFNAIISGKYGRQSFYANFESLLQAALNIKKQIDDDKNDNR